MSVEQEEAKRIIESLAREVHGIYGQHATDKGLKTPKWEDLPEEAKAISRDISRLILTKSQEAYHEGLKAGKAEAPPMKLADDHAPKSRAWSPEETVKFFATLKGIVDDSIAKITDIRRVSPIVSGLDSVISESIKEAARNVIDESDEIRERIRGMVTDELGHFFSEDDKKEE